MGQSCVGQDSERVCPVVMFQLLIWSICCSLVIGQDSCERDGLLGVVRGIQGGGVLGSHLVGFLNLVPNSVYGSDLVKFLSKQGNNNPKTVVQDLLGAKFLISESGSSQFDPSGLYSLVHMKGEGALNTKKLAICVRKSAEQVAEEIRDIVSQLFASFLSGDGKSVDYQGIASSPLWARYQRVATQLQRVDTETLDIDGKLAFFINLYNILCIHGLIEKGVPSNLLARFQFYKDTSYVIGGQLMTLNEIENGILRSNRASAGTLFLTPFSEGDPRLKMILPEADARIHFALNCGAKSCPSLRVYDGKDVQNQLSVATKEYLESNEALIVDAANNSVKLSKLLDWYEVDFGQNDGQVLRWVLNNMEDSKKKEKLQRVLRKGGFQVSHLDYNWGHNGI